MIFTTASTGFASSENDKPFKNFVTDDGRLTESGYTEIKNNATKYVYTEDKRVDQIENLMSKRNEVIAEINHNSDLTYNDKKKLESELKKLNNQLKKLGVMDGVPEEIKRVPSTSQVYSSISTQAVPPISYFDFYSSALNVTSWEASYTYNGKSYRTCTVNLQDKSGGMKYLSKVYQTDKVVKGSLYDLNQVNSFLLSGIKMAAKKANSYNPFIQARIGINILISMIPNYQPQYLITGSVVHTIPSVSKDEYIQYVYVYDDSVGDWRLCGAGNYAYCTISNIIYTRPGSVIIPNYLTKVQYFYGTYNTLRQESVYWFAAQKQAGIQGAPLDGVLKTIDIDYEENSSLMRIISINLAADQYPGLINLY